MFIKEKNNINQLCKLFTSTSNENKNKIFKFLVSPQILKIIVLKIICLARDVV
jgi:hypothetical protein